ncbi:ABC transporter permease [Actinacidiphila sp. ITFR-21]|uniref:ABC transporter permease n=1 Tax=Actinacidiphila sp. ITFR-21 TaxID=3075199 RepID=UPI00288C4C46|nr:ABC transporter permease [Streptomyces sp. ITFR-21]WNI14246.1 ABC transporter permease [Streptomyces sp. ITFR-21]
MGPEPLLGTAVTTTRDADVAALEKGVGPRRDVRALAAHQTAGPLAALVVAVIVFALSTSTFFNSENLALIAQQSVVVGTLALGQTLIILTSGIDLANGAILVLGSVVIGKTAVHNDPVLAALIGLAVCVVVGSVNGVLVSLLKLPPFIVTLGVMSVVAAASRLYTSSQSYPIDSDFLTFLNRGPTAGGVTITYGVMLWVVLTAVLGYVLSQTSWGVRVYAVGDNHKAAELAGIKVKRILLSVYVVAAIVYFFAAWQALGRTPTADPSGYTNANLDSITAVVIGGTSLFGGRGGVVGTFIGALIVTVLQNGLTQAGIDSLYQQVATGVLVVIAVGVDHLVRRRQTR